MRNPAYPSLATLGSRRSHAPIQRNPAYPSLATFGSRRSHAPIHSGRAPSFDRTVLRSPRGDGSGQVLPRHTRGSPYRCSLPGLAGFDDSRCVGPSLQRRPVKLTQHDPPSRRNSTPLKRIAGYRAPLTPRLARPSENDGGGAGIRTRGTGVTRARHFQCRTFGRSVTPPRLWLIGTSTTSGRLAEGRGFEPPRDLLGPYPISSRTPSTGLGHPSATSISTI